MRRVTLQQLRLLGCEAGAERGHHFLDAGERQAQHVEISFHQDGALRLAHGVLRDGQVVEQLPLVEHGRVGRVEILRLSFTEDPAPERDHARAQIVDRKQQTPPQARQQGAVLSFNEEPRLEQHRVTHAQPFHCVEQRVAPGRVAQAQGEDHLELEVPGGEVVPGHLGFGAVAQLAREPVGGRGHGLVQRLARVWAGGPPLRNRDPDPARDLAHRRGIVHAELLHEEGEDVAALVAHEAVVHPFPRDDGEVAVRAAVKRAGGAKIRTGALELHVLADDPHDVGRVPDLLDHVVRNEAHAVNSTIVTPCPPWFGGAKPKRPTRVSADTMSCTSWRSAPVPLPWMTRR